jgi:hypothetical protein
MTVRLTLGAAGHPAAHRFADECRAGRMDRR